MRPSSERGEGRLGSIFALVALVTAVWAAFKVVPVYMDHYDFQDKVKEICRTPKYRAPDDDKIKDMPEFAKLKELPEFTEILALQQRAL